MLTKKLSKHGNSLALVIDRSILDLLGIDERTALDISTDGRALVIVPAPRQTARQAIPAEPWQPAMSSTAKR